jgi:hypothetical protein
VRRRRFFRGSTRRTYREIDLDALGLQLEERPVRFDKGALDALARGSVLPNR